MDFQDVIRRRRSIRGYRPDPVPAGALARVLEAGRIAPTAANRQPVHLIVVTDPARRAALHDAYPRDWFSSAPVILVACVEPAAAWQRSDGFNAAEVDAAIVVDHVILAATDEGLGTCWICAFNEAIVKDVLGVPPEARVIAMTPLGYAAAEPRPFSRKPLGELVHEERW